MRERTIRKRGHLFGRTSPGRIAASCAIGLVLALAACAPTAAPSSTAAPAKPAESKPAATAAPAAQPTTAPAAKPAESKPAEAKPATAASPAAKPAEAKPAASPAAKAEAKPADKPSGPPAEIKIAGLFLNATLGFVPLHVGEKRGMFRDAGLTMQATNFNEPPATINSIGRDFDWGLVSPQVALNAFNGGRSELRIVAPLLNTSTIAYAVPKESPIQTPADLKGKKIAVAVANGTCHNWAIDMVRAAGLDPERDVEMVTGMPAGFPGLWTATKTGQFATTCITPPTTAQAVSKDGARIIFDSGQAVKAWTTDIMVSTTEVIQRKREPLTRQLAVWRNAAAFVADNPDESGRIWAEVANLDPDIAIATIKMVPKETWNLRLNLEAFQAIEKQMTGAGQLKAPANWQTLLDNSLLPADVRS